MVPVDLPLQAVQAPALLVASANGESEQMPALGRLVSGFLSLMAMDDSRLGHEEAYICKIISASFDSKVAESHLTFTRWR